jgi:hypothetical protein
MELHEKNIQKLRLMARRCGLNPEALLNLIVCTALEELEHAPDLCDETPVWPRYTEVGWLWKSVQTVKTTPCRFDRP